MYDEFGSEPIDSFDAYRMGLRPARCTGCEYARLKWELGDKFLALHDWLISVYELDAEPSPGQGEPYTYKGHPIRHRASFMSIGHSDECYQWKPPNIETGGAR